MWLFHIFYVQGRKFCQWLKIEHLYCCILITVYQSNLEMMYSNNYFYLMSLTDSTLIYSPLHINHL